MMLCFRMSLKMFKINVNNLINYYRVKINKIQFINNRNNKKMLKYYSYKMVYYPYRNNVNNQNKIIFSSKIL